MDGNVLMASMLFGSIGLGMLMYGKKAGRPVPLIAGLALLTIPYGETMSYGELAKKIGEPKAVRAVGAANGQNPIPIIVPCHRVIGSDGSLTGFGGGLVTATRRFPVCGNRARPRRESSG